MDLIKLSSTTANPTELSVGEHIFGYTSLLWVERYRDPGEFQIEAFLSSGLIDKLPIGSFLTHLDTEVIMLVENHQIKQPKAADATITISGRCYTSFLENRIIGEQEAYVNNEIADWVIGADETWDQAVDLIDRHLTNPTNPDDGLPGLEAMHTCSGTVTIEERTVQRTDVYKVLNDILKVDDLGIKSVRPTPTDPSSYFVIYRGDDVSKKVRFSQDRDDLDNVEYLFSNKKLKNQAIMEGRWVQTYINPTGADGYNRRTMLVDVSYIDERQPSYPTAVPRALIIAAMQIKGDEALKAQNNVSITQADISPDAQWQYRRDYGMGDLVTVNADFGASGVFRVIEFAETDDENGTSGHPTLAIPGEY